MKLFTAYFLYKHVNIMKWDLIASTYSTSENRYAKLYTKKYGGNEFSRGKRQPLLRNV